MHNLRKIGRIFLMQWSAILQYRTDMILWTISEALTPLVALAVWYKVAQSSSDGVLTTQETVTYYVLVVLVVIGTSAWNGFFLSQEILKGELVRFLIRPMSVFWHHLANNMVEKFLKFFIPIPVFILCLWLFPNVFTPVIYSWSRLMLFLVSLSLAAAISFTLDLSLGSLAFWIEDANELRGFRYMLETIAAGILIPLVMLPPVLQAIARLLPFRYIISLPIEILMGQLNGLSVIIALLYQVLWVLALLGILSVLWKRGLRRYAVPGQ